MRSVVSKVFNYAVCDARSTSNFTLYEVVYSIKFLIYDGVSISVIASALQVLLRVRYKTKPMNEQKVIALYIMLEENRFDFVEQIHKEDTETLKLLQEVLMADCKELDEEDLNLNKIGVNIVENELKRRKKHD